MSQVLDPRTRRVAIAGSVGNVIEWYDWTAYALFAVYFAKQFFPSSDPVAALVGTFAVFAVGFVARPVGSYVIGKVTDRTGRKASLTLSILLMAGASFLMALLPTAAAWGAFAALALVALRLVQGFALGGETGAASALLAESSPNSRRGFVVSLYTATVAIGTLTGSIIGVVLSLVLTPEAISDWGWRIPFAIGGLLGLVGLVIRRHLHETLDAKVAPPKDPIRTTLREYRPAAILTVILIGSVAMTFFAMVAGFPSLASIYGSVDDWAFQANAIALLLMIVLVPLFGRLSDRVGRRPVLISGLVGVGITIFPALLLLEHADEAWRVFAAQLVIIVPIAATQGPLISTMVERFPPQLRGAGFGLFYALGTAIFGGTAPMISSWLNGEDRPMAFAAYLAAFALIAAAVIWRAPETADRPMQS